MKVLVVKEKVQPNWLMQVVVPVGIFKYYFVVVGDYFFTPHNY